MLTFSLMTRSVSPSLLKRHATRAVCGHAFAYMLILWTAPRRLALQPMTS